MSPKTNIIILLIVGLIALAVLGYGYYYYTQGIDQAIQGAVDNQTGLHRPLEIKLESENIRLFYPEPPFEFKAGIVMEVLGEARVFENQVAAELAYVDGEVIGKQTTTAKAKEIGEFGSFKFTFQLPSKEKINGRQIKLTVFSTSAKDGSKQNQVYFPLKIID